MRFAHLSKLPIKAGGSMKVSAGQYMGTTGETGNAHGKHVHVALPAGPQNDYAFGNFFKSIGVSLRKGGKLRYDNTLVNAHKGETVLTSRITKQFEDNLLNSTGSSTNFGDIHVTMSGEVSGNPETTGRKIAMGIKKELGREERRYRR